MHWDHEPNGAVWCPRFSVLGPDRHPEGWTPNPTGSWKGALNIRLQRVVFPISVGAREDGNTLSQPKEGARWDCHSARHLNANKPKTQRLYHHIQSRGVHCQGTGHRVDATNHV